MSRFYASVKGSRGETTRQGSKESGMRGHIRGWNIGVDVCCYTEKGKDHIVVSKTGGSHSPGTQEELCHLVEE